MKCPKCNTDNPGTQKFCGECATPLPSSKEIPVTKTLETPTEELTRGTTFAGRYEIIEELGKGGMGKVYRVEDKKIKEEVALKLIKPEIASDKKTIERFSNELKMARKIAHRNVCKMYDLGEEKGSNYITMEYVPGQDLRGLIRQSGQLAGGTTINIAKQVCEGLAEAHRLGVVHRDLKPQNIMIDKEGNVRIMDFGIARSVKGKGITGAGVMIGTPEYMSPEQVEGREASQRSDIYSLGVILYEMVTGQIPFEGGTPFAIGLKHKSEIPKDPRELNAQIPADLSHVILKCLEKRKEDRFEAAEGVLSELIKIEKGIPTTERVVQKKKPITSKEITVKFSLNKLVIPALAVLAILIAALFLFIGKGPSLDPNRIVVAAFENQTGNSSLDSIGRMAADWLTQGLSQTGLIEVVPASTANSFLSEYRGKDPIFELARETGSGVVVSGAFYLEGDNLKFHAQVNDVKKGKLLRALDPVSGPVKNPTKPIETLRQRLMGTLAAVFDPELKELSGFSEPPNYEAYQEFMQGTQFFVQREFNKAIEHLTRASSFDPTFTLPVLWSAIAHLNLGEYASADALAQEVDKSRERLASGDRHTLDWLKAILRGDWTGAHHAWLQVVKYAPEGFGFYYQVGSDAIRINHPKEAVEAFRKCDPEGPMMKGWYYYWGWFTKAHHMLGNHKKELKVARRGRKQYPELLSNLWYEVRALAALGKIREINKLLDECLNLPPQRDWTPAEVMRYAAHELRVHGYKEESFDIADRAISWYKAHKGYRSSPAWTLYIAERWEEAQAIYEELHQEFPDSVDYLGYIGALAVRMGNREKALKISDQLKNIDKPYLFGNHTYWRARIAALLEQKELAMRLIREALGQGTSYTQLHPDMNLEPLWDYPPFKELIKPKG